MHRMAMIAHGWGTVVCLRRAVVDGKEAIICIIVAVPVIDMCIVLTGRIRAWSNLAFIHNKSKCKHKSDVPPGPSNCQRDF